MASIPKRGRHRGLASAFPLLEILREHPARVYSVAAAAIALVAEYATVPQEVILALVAAFLGAGEVTQRVENAKTSEAFELLARVAARRRHPDYASTCQSANGFVAMVLTRHGRGHGRSSRSLCVETRRPPCGAGPAGPHG